MQILEIVSNLFEAVLLMTAKMVSLAAENILFFIVATLLFATIRYAAPLMFLLPRVILAVLLFPVRFILWMTLPGSPPWVEVLPIRSSTRQMRSVRDLPPPGMSREAWLIRELNSIVDGSLIREAEQKAEREWMKENGIEPSKPTRKIEDFHQREIEREWARQDRRRRRYR